jgi:hypothetical protein
MMNQGATKEDILSQVAVRSKVLICSLLVFLESPKPAFYRNTISYNQCSRLFNMQFTAAAIMALVVSTEALVPRQTISRSSPRLCDDFLVDLYPYKRIDYQCCQDGSLGGCKIRKCRREAPQT